MNFRVPPRPRPAVSVVAVLVAAVLALTACGSDRNVPGPDVTVTESGSGSAGAPGAPTSASSTAPSSTAPAKPTGKPVHVSSMVIGDGSTVGVGLPISVLLSRKIKDARAFQKATVVKVNGNVVNGNWYFERRYGITAPVEGDYRLQNYWPAHAHITMSLRTKGLSAGAGLYFKNNLSLDFHTGPANILTVDNYTHKLTYLRDGQLVETFPVSLGYPNTPTKRGVKVIMEKGLSICMSGPGYDECGIKFTQRLTYDGEYLHAAPWNVSHIESGVNSSNGCTNLLTANASTLYDQLEIGDVVKYPNADGPLMQLGDGYGDWNVPWGQWQSGGLYRVS